MSAPGPLAVPVVVPRGDPWDRLLVLDRLEVGPPELETRRIVTPYRVTVNGREAATELIYRFAEDVFNRERRVDRNLAAVMTAQVALNYGLFAREIVFHGSFDEHDRRFLRDMAENTAREITVKKFLEPNPFLRGEAAALPAVQRRQYCRAQIRFERPADGVQGPMPPDPWGDVEHHAILSSGGKESLLTLGVLEESGKETYPIFINESGRHWLTALNAYRALSTNRRNVHRVWTNADRVFTWFLRQLPFVRQDFQDVRSDEYPIRLWTVAVFLFGALPLLKKYGIGRISIGDEHDTSRRARYRGIVHYDGLYDQSRYFDGRLTKYFTAKGWGVEQFSLLRSLSELLVQQILTQRYPELFGNQMSCHAAHVDQERVYPCGRCEKCRRIVGMLVAIGADPADCGYTDAQVTECLARLATAGVHQESEGVEHLMYLLEAKGVLPADAKGFARPRPREEVVHLRFDPDRSPWNEIPADMRAVVYSIFLQYAVGAVSRAGRRWVPCDALAGPSESRA